jgi:hypothetical protein
MKQLACLLVCLAFSVTSRAQYETGDAELNMSLTQMDADATGNFQVFQSDMTTTYEVAPVKIELWSTQDNFTPGDIYLVLETSKILNKPVDDVAKVYKTNKKKGWGVIAKELGIKPGSAEFHALKGSAVKQAAKGKAKGKKP